MIYFPPLTIHIQDDIGQTNKAFTRSSISDEAMEALISVSKTIFDRKAIAAGADIPGVAIQLLLIEFYDHQFAINDLQHIAWVDVSKILIEIASHMLVWKKIFSRR